MEVIAQFKVVEHEKECETKIWSNYCQNIEDVYG